MADSIASGELAAPTPMEAAFAALLPEIIAVKDEQLVPLNVDVVTASTLVLGALPKLRALRQEIVQLPGFDIARFDKLEQYAFALNQANGLYRSAVAAKGTVQEIGNEIALVRDRLHANAVSLADYGLLDAERLKEIKKANGYRAIATDIVTLITVFREHWATVEGKTPVTLSALSDAGHRAAELLAAVGERDLAPVTTGEAARLRQQAFTLFAKAYEDARAAVAYLRRDHDDAAELTPTFWATRSPRRRAPESEDTTEVPPAVARAAAVPVEVDDDKPLVVHNPLGLPITPPLTS